jgi:hypothetical protein
MLKAVAQSRTTTWKRLGAPLMAALVLAGAVWLTVAKFEPAHEQPPATGPVPRATRDAYLGIEMGMTERQVENVLGGPAGCYARPNWAITSGGVSPKANGRQSKERKEWVTREGHIVVGFADDGTSPTSGAASRPIRTLASLNR